MPFDFLDVNNDVSEINESSTNEFSELPDSSGDISYKADLLDSSGDISYNVELPDSSGDVPYKTNLSEVSGEVNEVNILRQDEIIDRVQSGEIILTDSQEKGNYGEMVADQTMRDLGYDRISQDMVTELDSSIHQGIDGVYYNSDGNPPYIIVDAKYNTAQLEQTQDGKQMSESWIESRLDAAVGKEKADDIREAMLEDNVDCYVIRVGIGDDVNSPVVFEKLDGKANIVSKGGGIDA